MPSPHCWWYVFILLCCVYRNAFKTAECVFNWFVVCARVCVSFAEVCNIAFAVCRNCAVCGHSALLRPIVQSPSHPITITPTRELLRRRRRRPRVDAVNMLRDWLSICSFFCFLFCCAHLIVLSIWLNSNNNNTAVMFACMSTVLFAWRTLWKLVPI